MRYRLADDDLCHAAIRTVAVCHRKVTTYSGAREVGDVGMLHVALGWSPISSQCVAVHQEKQKWKGTTAVLRVLFPRARWQLWLEI